jgi:hypothetical protein
MTILDFAKFISPRKPETALKIINEFKDNKVLTFEDLQANTGLGESNLRKFIGKFYEWNAIEGRHDHDKNCKVYRLDLSGLKGKVDGKIFDAIKFHLFGK